jgi:hypothetical protein
MLTAALAGCATTQAIEAPKPVRRDATINSLALEQCVGENGREACLDRRM